MIKSTCNTDGGFTCLNRSYLINYDDLKDAHYKWVDSEMQNENRNKENKWTQSIAACPVKSCCSI